MVRVCVLCSVFCVLYSSTAQAISARAAKLPILQSVLLAESLPQTISPLFTPPAGLAGDFGGYRSPLLFDDGGAVKTPADWARRRAEILRYWQDVMGTWPPLIERPVIEYRSEQRRDNFTQHTVSVEIVAQAISATPGRQMVDGYILVPDGPGPFPAVLVAYYDAETGIGKSKTPDKPAPAYRDFALQLARRGFVTMSIGTPDFCSLNPPYRPLLSSAKTTEGNDGRKNRWTKGRWTMDECTFRLPARRDSSFVSLFVSHPSSLRSSLVSRPSSLVSSPAVNTSGEENRVPTLQPLSALGYVAANCCNALANMKEVDPERIGVVGHSYGGKWAMFASCLYEKFACAVWSDPGIVFDEGRPNVNYWEPWYLGYDSQVQRQRGVPSESSPRTGAYKKLMADGRDLHELHALMAPRPFLVSGGSEDRPERWKALNHTIAVNDVLGYKNRVAMSNRDGHSPTPESNEQIYGFFEHFLKRERK